MVKLSLNVNLEPGKPIYDPALESIILKNARTLKKYVHKTDHGTVLQDYLTRAVEGLGGIPLRETYSPLIYTFTDWPAVSQIPENLLFVGEALTLASVSGLKSKETITQESKDKLTSVLSKIQESIRSGGFDYDIPGNKTTKVLLEKLCTFERNGEDLHIGIVHETTDGVNKRNKALIVSDSFIYTMSPRNMLHPRLAGITRKELITILGAK